MLPGKSTNTIRKLLSNKDIHLNYGVDLSMPGNSVIMVNYTSSKEEQLERLKLAEPKVKEFINDIKNNIEKITIPSRAIKEVLRGPIANLALFKVYNLPKRFNSDDNCNGCGSCEKVCSFKNISMSDNKPVWGKNCEACLGCFHYCPKKAININQYTIDFTRYHHPDITLSDIIGAD